MVRKKMKKSVDSAVFKHTASKTALANVAGRNVPRGGTRL